MAAVAPLPPRVLKDILVAAGYSVIGETAKNWAIARGADDVPIMIAKTGRVVAVELMNRIFHTVSSEVQNAILKKIDELAAPPPQAPAPAPLKP